jgi:hypothetical protein
MKGEAGKRKSTGNTNEKNRKRETKRKRKRKLFIGVLSSPSPKVLLFISLE